MAVLLYEAIVLHIHNVWRTYVKGNVWVPMASHFNAQLILTSEMWIFEKLTTYFDI